MGVERLGRKVRGRKGQLLNCVVICIDKRQGIGEDREAVVQLRLAELGGGVQKLEALG
jgi:hypothetical protein